MQVKMEKIMYHRLVFIPVLLIISAFACARLPGGQPVNTLTPELPADTQESTFPQSISTPDFDFPTFTVPVPTASIPTATSTPTLIPENNTSETGNGEENISYKLQPGSPLAMENIFHQERGCNWMGIGGQVFGESGQPIGMLVVEIGGQLDGEKKEALTLTGSASQWGPGGFEFDLAEKPILSSGSLWVQVLDLEGNPLSERVYIDTFDDCERATVMVNFIHPSAIIYFRHYFPLINQNP
jgi:hypothetical protein